MCNTTAVEGPNRAIINTNLLAACKSQNLTPCTRLLNLSKLRIQFSEERCLFMGKTSYESPDTQRLYVGTLRSGKRKPQPLPVFILSFRVRRALRSIFLHGGRIDSVLSNRCTWECTACIIRHYTRSENTDIKVYGRKNSLSGARF